MNKLYLIDAYALIFRAHYAFISRPMRNKEGMNTSAVFGFTKFLRDLIVKERPKYMGVAFDPKGGNFRNDLYPLYKANRSETPEDIIFAVPYIKRIISALRIPCMEVPNYEADDVIGTISAKAAKEGYEVFMVTPDKDFGQLVKPNVKIYKQRKSGEGIEIVGCEELKEQYGIDDPRLVIDILALWGDASDNIPGVPGIGEKGAVKLVNEFGTVEDILANTEKLKGRQKDNIIANSEQLLLSKILATIDVNVPIEFKASDFEMEEPDCEALREIYKELDFNMFIREMDTQSTSPFNGVICPRGLGESTSSEVVINNEAESGGVDRSGESIGGAKTIATASTATDGVQYDLFGSPIEVPKQSKSEVSKPESGELSLFGDSFSSGYESINTVAHNYSIISNREELKSLIEKLSSYKEFCFDVESSGFDPFCDRIVGISFAVEEYAAYYLPISLGDSDGYLSMVKPLFEDENIDKIGHNIKFDILMLAGAGVEVKGFKYDTMILHYLLDPESRHGMNHLARVYLNYSPVEIEELIGRGSKQLTMDRVPVDIAGEYGAEDADVTLRLKKAIWVQIEERELAQLYRTIEEPLIDAISKIELTGVKIDVGQLEDYGKILNGQMDDLENQIREIAQTPDLKINSPMQVGVVLFEKLKIEAKPKRTKTKQYSTDEEYLKSLADRHPIVGMILEYRGLKKLLSTYIEALPLLVNRKTGRVHTSYNQAVTATGRLSSTNPNLQNIPIRDDQGRQIRKAFIPSVSDRLILAADYSQVELRLMAHLSGDENMLRAFHEGQDIHAATASLLFNVPLEEVTSEQRRKAKTANFGIIYGISAFGLRQRMGNITMEEAKNIIDGYFRSYPKVKEYMDNVIEGAREQGYVETIFGRRRWLPDIRSSNATIRSLAERNAINAPIQGSAADIIKIAMNRIHEEFERRGIKSEVIMQVHDELVVDMLKSEQAEVVALVKELMESAAQLKVELTVECGIGENWLEAH